jgi:protein SCO1/2
VSVSIDPTVDTPRKLHSWGETFGAGPGWTLVTGSKPDIDGLLKSLGVFIADKQYHSPVALLGNHRAGVWHRANGLTPPDDLLRQLDGLSALPAAGTAVEVAP